MPATRLNPGLRPGLTAAERTMIRTELADWYADHGIDEDQAMRSHLRGQCDSEAAHDPCLGEESNGPGCLCECHDATAPEAGR